MVINPDYLHQNYHPSLCHPYQHSILSSKNHKTYSLLGGGWLPMKRELPMSRETGGGWMPLGKRDRGTGSFSEDILSKDILQEIEAIRNNVN